MRKNNSKQIQEEVFVEAESANTSIVNVANMVADNKKIVKEEEQSEISIEREMFEE